MTLFVFVPAVLILILSLFKTNFLSWEFVGLNNYVKMFNNSFPKAIGNSMLYLLFIPVPGSIIGIFLALSMADLNKKHRNKLIFLFMLPSFAAGLIVSQFWKWIIKLTHLDVSYQFPGVPFIALTILIGTVGMQTLFLSTAIQGIDPSQYEAAKVDGATWWQIKFRIILPQIVKTASIILLFGIVGALQVWETIYMIAPFESTASMMYRVIADGFFFGKYGLASAECLVMALIIVFITQVKNRVEKA